MKFFPLFFLLALSGCGYHAGSSREFAQYQTISVPYINGDEEGQFTSVLIRTLSESGQWEYVSNKGELSLIVKIVDTKTEFVGYNRFIGQYGTLQPWVVPTESRLSGLVEIKVIDTKTQKVLLGPTLLSSNVRYDYDAEFNMDDLVGFSLGQYNFIENSKGVAKIPLNQRLSENIVNYLINSW